MDELQAVPVRCIQPARLQRYPPHPTLGLPETQSPLFVLFLNR